MRDSAWASRLISSLIPSPAAPPRSRGCRLVLAAALFVGAATHVAGAASLAGVHWYSGDSSMLDLSVPAGERGYNVEVIFDTGWCDGDPGTDPGGVRAVAATAKAHGLVNIIRVDYHQQQAVPTSSGEFGAWATGFIKCTQELGDLASLFIVGNEPNIEDGGRAAGDIRGDEYASAFNYLYSRKAEMPSTTQLLATFNSPFTPPGWMLDMSSRLTGVDGFVLHTGGVRAGCRDPRQACSYGGWPFDGAFRYYRDVIGNIHSSWWSRPVYITEFNTYTGDVGSEPDVNYPVDWINQAFEEIRSYNASRGTRPAVKALCWFVDRPQSWPRFSLRNIGTARTDMGEEFKNPANRGVGGSCPNDALATLSDRWKLEIWNNKDFTGGTVEQRYDAAGSGGFSFNWGSGAASSCVGNDNFALRFSRQAYFPTSASYTFTATTDDGVRLFVDGNKVVDDWRDMAPTAHTAVVSLAAGWHDLRMDYYENAGGAVATLGWTGGGTAPSNVARNAVGWAASSVYAAAYGGDKAYDGTVSAASKWTSNGATSDSWLALDLGRSYDVTQFVVRHAGSAGELTGYNTQAFRVESGTSLSGPWNAQATVANTAQDPTSTVTLASPLTTRYVRLYITDAGIDNYARIPEFEVYGVASGGPPSPATLVNGDFESSTPGGAVGNGWTAFSSAGYAPTFTVASDQVHGGSLAQRVTSPQPSSNDKFGGVYQVVATTPGLQYTVRAWNRTHFTGGLAWDHIARLGIDLGGGTSFEAPAVQWSEFDSAKDQWHPLEVAVTATSSSTTIYLESWRKWASGGDSLTWFDDVQVVQGTPPPVNHPPTAVASANPTSGPAPLTVAFSGTGSSDPDGDALTYAWSFGDGAQGTGATVSHAYAARGSYTATLTVNDGRGGSNGASVAIAVTNRPPTAVASANPTSGPAPLTVAFSGTGSSDPDGDALTYTWSFGDGAQGTGATASHLYASSGTYTATLTVNDGHGGTKSASVAVTANPPANRPPTAVAAANPTSGPAPLTVAFNGSASSDPDGDALTYTWTFGDSSQGSGATVSHTYAAGGSYTATLTVNDGHGGSNSATVAISVQASAGPLVNGGFESSTPGSALGTGWIAFSSSGYTPTFAVVSDVVHGGSFAQRVTSPQPSSNDKFAGVYQVVATTPGVPYTVHAWSQTHFTGGNAWDHIARLGIDLNGGNDFQASSVQWIEFDSGKDVWQRLDPVVTATGGSITIYLESWRKWASGGDSLTWFDDVQVGPNGPPPVEHPPTAVATASPTSGPAPLAVAFNGSGSTDPDGDPLTYAWTFGDGSQASGVKVSHTYSGAATYHAALTVDDGRGGTHSAEVLIVVDPPSGNRPPIAVISASPKSATIPFTVTLDASGSSDPDGDPLTYSWAFADGVKGSGPTMQRTFVDANGDMRETGGYLVTLTVSDGRGGTTSASVRIGVFPPGCPESKDFDAIRAQLASQGQDLAFVKIGFHTGGGGTFNGLGKWEHCLDAAGVPFAVKSVPNSRTAGMGDAAELRVRSGVPHTIVFRRCCDAYELPTCAQVSASTEWSTCTMDNAQQEALAHWQRHLQAFPPDVQAYKQLVWVETINEPWKGSNTRNNAEWLAKFSYCTALEALAAGYNYAAFGWSTGEPQYGPRPPDQPLSPEFQWDGPEMQKFLRLAAQYPDRIAISLHEYDLDQPTLRATYPDSVGRFEKLFQSCDANGIARPTVLITEFGWPGVPSVSYQMSADNLPWAAGLYAKYPQVKGVNIWDGGDLSPVIPALTAYAVQNYFAIPKSSRATPTCAAPAVDVRTRALCRTLSGAGGDAPPAEP